MRETFSRLELSRSEEEEEEEEEEQELRALFSSAHDEASSRHSSDDVLVFLETKTKRKDFDESKGEDDVDDDDDDKEDKENADDLLVDDEDDEDDESSLPSCAICLTAPALENSCFTVPCLHSFCARCIVRWANFQEEEENEQRKKRGLSSTHHQHHRHGSGGGSSFAAKCPSCRVPFENLLCYRELDGSVHKLRGELDLREHPLCLLKRSKWLGLEKDEDEMHGTRRSSYEEDSFEEEDRRDFHRYHQMKSSNNKSPAYYDDIDDEYFAKRGGARVVIGNRRFGANGFVASGRALARPIQQPSVKKEKDEGGCVFVFAEQSTLDDENEGIANDENNERFAANAGGDRERSVVRHHATAFVVHAGTERKEIHEKATPKREEETKRSRKSGETISHAKRVPKESTD